MIRGAIFDLDGVLLDSMAVWNDLGVRYLKKRDIEPEDGLSQILFSMSMEQGADYLKAQYYLPDTPQEILAGIEQMIRDFYFYEVQPKEGAEELLEFLQEQKVKMIAATSSPREHVTKALQRTGLYDYLQQIYTTGEVGVSKHEPRIYQLAAESLGAKPEETLVFEDSLYALKTAKKAGFRAIGVYDADGETDQEGVRQTGEVYITSLSEFRQYWMEVDDGIIETDHASE
ncbi:HAD family phosphatase [uncultured Eubacterium sp.]|uniref:HAD family hydrolase n=1 Tax=uncultured Eubacterium sp. TaxID=165185 RepID=UPI0025D830F9|nr:HAD family phosphatase [uncultured Eubacterium sp.]MCI6537830.1 HAD family phosphatase [Lachnospiraceae bacterium]